MMLGLANFEGDPTQAPADARAPELGAAIERVLDRLEERPDGSVLSWMLHHDADGIAEPDGDRANTKLMLSGLQEPRDLIALAVWSLGTHPEQLDEVVAIARS
jgi:cytochrome P450